MDSEFRPPAVKYRELAPAGGSAIVSPEQPESEVIWWAVPSAETVVGETEHPESWTLVAGPEFATVIWIVWETLAVNAKVAVDAVLLLSHT